MRPGIGQRDVGGPHVADHVLAEIEVVDGHPAGVDDVDEHEGVVAREMDVDVIRRVVGAVPGQLDSLPSHLQGVSVGERHLGHRAGRVVVTQQEPPGFLVPDPDHVAEYGGRGAVVGVVVGVDQVDHSVAHALGGGDLVDRAAQVVTDGRRRVEQHDAVSGNQER
jgi:hypothetical protein